MTSAPEEVGFSEYRSLTSAMQHGQKLSMNAERVRFDAALWRALAELEDC